MKHIIKMNTILTNINWFLVANCVLTLGAVGVFFYRGQYTLGFWQFPFIISNIIFIILGITTK